MQHPFELGKFGYPLGSDYVPRQYSRIAQAGVYPANLPMQYTVRVSGVPSSATAS